MSKANLLGSSGTSRPSSINEAAQMLERISDLLSEESSRGGLRYAWAEDTLTGIYETVEKTGRVSEAQRRAVDNIENSRRS